MTRITLDPDGDVCLRLPYHRLNRDDQVLADVQNDNGVSLSGSGRAQSSEGAGSRNTVDLIVSSKVLATVSPVFKTMFYGNFREGIEAAATRACLAPYIQELPEDDTEAAPAFCALTHGKMEHLPKEPMIPFLLGIAEFAKKYLCIKVLEFPGRAWLRRELELEELSRMHCEVRYYTVERYCDLLYFAYTLDLPHEFAVIMGMIAVNLHGKYDDLKSLKPERFNHPVKGFLRSLRRECACTVCKAVLSRAAMYHSPAATEHGPVPSCKAIAHSRYIEAMNALGIWPTDPEYIGSTIQAVLDKMPDLSTEFVSTVVDEPVACTCPNYDAPCHVQLSLKSDGLVFACSEMREALLGRRAEFFSYHQCLDCLKAGGIVEIHELDCRSAHAYPKGIE